ncbi:MAG: hypothetical protein HYR60_14810 [Acidobacteria bacterium]|nr:hypothetical protein [Acidobacteriota bacterium]
MNSGSKSEQGFVLVATAVCVIAVVGMIGLAIDLGRVYIAKNEAHTYSDLTALAAAQQLDGTQAGLTRARSAVANSPMRWNMNTQSFQGTTVEFSNDLAGWSANPASPAGVRYVRVTADVRNIGLFFMPAIGPTAGRVVAQSVAGQQPLSAFPPGGPGVMPFAPLAHDPADPNFGFAPGDVITLRWPSSTQGNKQFCPADNAPQWIAQSTLGGGDERGYIQDTSSSAIRAAIEDDHIDYTVTLGLPVTMTGGVKQTQADSLEHRAAQDTNTGATTYAQYQQTPGNGRRIGLVPIVDANNNFIVIGFASVFIYTNYNQGGNKSLCAEYIGPYHLEGSGNTGGGGGTGAGVYEVRLIQ